MVNRAELRTMQLIGNLDIGGAQEVVRTLSSYLIECSFPTVVCTLQDGPLRQEIERMGIPVEVLTGRQHSILAFPQYVREMLRIRRDLIAIVQKYNINVIQTHLLRTLDFLVASLKFRYDRLLIFWTVHNSHFQLKANQLSDYHWLLRPKQFVHRMMYRAVLNQVNGFIAVSDEVKQAVLQTMGVAEDRVTVICNGVDTRRYQKEVDRAAIRQSLGIDGHARVMVLVGTLKEQKGHRYLIEAAAPVIAQNPDLNILFVGDGELRDSLQAQVRDAGLEGNIHFLGNRNDVPDLLAASDYFVLPSLWEGLPMALIEAMASGLPVVATQVSGSQQVMVPGETGWMVAPGDVKQLREAITNLITNPNRALAMGQASRLRAETVFGARKQAEEHVQLYRREWEKINHQ